MAEEHALLSPSSAHRWLKCTPSARLEQQFPITQTQYAAEGKYAHRLAEVCLRQSLGEKVRRPAGYAESPYYNPDLEDHLATYVEMVQAAINRHRDPVILFEQKLDYSKWVPDGFGTADVVIISDLGIEVIDFKYGIGVPVDAKDNPQLMLYGLGAYDQYGVAYDINTLHLTIIQPRINNNSTWEVEVDALLKWAKEIEPRAKLAAQGLGDFVAGEHCHFCRAKAACRARAEANLELAKYDFKKPELLTNEELGEILYQAMELQAWTNDVKEYALEQALNNNKIRGWKLVEGRSNRQYADEAEVIKTLKAAGITEVFEQKLFTITKLEKALGKKQVEALLGDLIIKPAGKPTLVPESDGRPEIGSTAAAQTDFKGED